MFDHEQPTTFAHIIAQYGPYETAKLETTYPDGRVTIEYLIGPIPVLRRLDSFDFQEYDSE